MDLVFPESCSRKIHVRTSRPIPSLSGSVLNSDDFFLWAPFRSCWFYCPEWPVELGESCGCSLITVEDNSLSRKSMLQISNLLLFMFKGISFWKYQNFAPNFKFAPADYWRRWKILMRFTTIHCLNERNYLKLHNQLSSLHNRLWFRTK